MIDPLVAFVDELRAVGVPVSTVEVIDAAEALRYADLSTPESLKAALGSTLVKSERHYRAFETAFDVFFGLRSPDAGSGREEEAASSPAAPSAGGGAADDTEALLEAVLAALIARDQDQLRRLARLAVDQLAGMEPGRPVGGRYYLYRVMRRIDAEGLLERLLTLSAPPELEDAFEANLRRRAAADLVEQFRSELRREIVRRLIQDRGSTAVAQTLRLPLIEDIDLMHATREELADVERAVAPLARKLATRLAQQRKRGEQGRLDVRRTIRRSLEYGGALVDPRFRPPRKSKPELVLLCDVSGSMATFARFTMQLTYAIGNQFSAVRSFAFIDGLDEVTGFFSPGTDFHDGLVGMSEEADLVRRDGHSDYGRALTEFHDRYSTAITARSTVIVTGDARNNYRDSAVDILGEIADSARALFWLNPEARRYWDTGDSIMSTYAPVCDSVEQVRSLRELEAFVEQVALPRSRPIRRHAVPLPH